MPVKRRAGKQRREYTDAELDWLRGGSGSVEIQYFATLEQLSALWESASDVIVREHVAAHPGSRPTRWWAYDAPERRRREGGVGTPTYEHVPAFFAHIDGVPAAWVFEGDRDAAGRKSMGCVLLDPDDPPMFESQATYLDRLQLFLPGERKRLRKAAFVPESVITILGIEFEDETT